MQPHRPLLKERLAGYVWASVWLWPLVDPVQQAFRGRVHPGPVAAAGIVAFIALYLVSVNSGFDLGFRPPGRRHLVILGVVTALALLMAIAYAGPTTSGWLGPILFAGAAGAATLKRPYVFAWLLGAPAALLIIGMARHVDSSSIAANTFSALMACALVYTVKQMVGYIHLLRNTQAELAKAAVAEERLRFARDLHELLGHTLTLIVVKAQVVRRLAERDPAAAASSAVDIEQIGRQALVEVREAVTGYRERTFAAELDGARTALVDAGIEVTLTEVGTPLPPIADTIFGWAVREGATNIIRHSGARTCTIVVRRTDAGSSLEIRDDGTAGSGEGTGNGLRGLRERLAAAGGSLEAGPARGGGFRLLATLPRCTTGTPNATEPGPAAAAVTYTPATAR